MIQRFFFCINSGRSGSFYLNRILNTCSDVFSTGENAPNMSGKYLHLVNEYPLSHSFDERKIKVKKIEQIIKNVSPKKTVYSETNHMFIKTFFDVVIDHFGSKVEVIILRRNLSKVLKSFIDLEYFGTNKVSYDWMVKTTSPSTVITPIDDFDNMDHYDRCISYLIDIQGRANKFKEKYSHIKTHEILLSDLNNFVKIEEFLNQLKVHVNKQSLSGLLGTKVNSRDKNKRHNVSVDYCKERIYEYIDKANKKNIKIPNLII